MNRKHIVIRFVILPVFAMLLAAVAFAGHWPWAIPASAQRALPALPPTAPGASGASGAQGAVGGSAQSGQRWSVSTSSSSSSPSSPLVAAGNGFTYQGKLIDTNSPANGQYDLQFTLYDTPTAGTLVGSPITMTNQTVTDGLFTVQLDFGASAFQGSARWLEIAVQPTSGGGYTTLSPRQPLTAAPYALSLKPGAIITGSLSPVTSPVISVTNTNTGLGSTGIYGSGGRYGVRGATNSGWGVYGSSSSSAGVYGNGGSYGVWGQSGNGIGVNGDSFSASASSPGVYGTNSGGSSGVIGFSYGGSGSTSMGVSGISGSTDGVGVKGQSDTGSGATGVWGASASGYGVYGTGGSFGVYGYSGGGYALYGYSNSGTGVYGSGGFQGVYATGGSYGVQAYGSTAVYASGSSTAVYATAGSYGVQGYGNTDGVYAQGGSYGVYAQGNTALYGSGSSYGVQGYGNTGVYGSGYYGVEGQGTYGVYGTGSYLAGYFANNVQVVGYLYKTGGGFQIDDPLDPANKYLYHSFVESPDMKNLYDGVVTLDTNGEASVQMPAWFEEVNKDFRYQLTAIGAPGPNLYVAQEIKNRRFSIAGGKQGMKVSWQVTGTRHDAYAAANPIPVEQAKPANEQGYYLHPEVYGQPKSKSIDAQRSQQAQQQSPQLPQSQQPPQPQPKPQPTPHKGP
jgi:hypothetical protein